MEDQRIIEAYWRRDESAVKETADRYGSYCFAIAQNILQNHQDAEECVNDAYLKAWNAIPPARPSSLKLFLGRIVRNLSLDRYRASHWQKRGGGAVPAALDEMEDFVAGMSDVQSEVERAEMMRAINLFLYGLPRRECDIFIRRYFYFDSTAKISSTYGLKENNVLRILSRTRAKLKRYLEKEGYTV